MIEVDEEPRQGTVQSIALADGGEVEVAIAGERLIYLTKGQARELSVGHEVVVERSFTITPVSVPVVSSVELGREDTADPEAGIPEVHNRHIRMGPSEDGDLRADRGPIAEAFAFDGFGARICDMAVEKPDETQFLGADTSHVPNGALGDIGLAGPALGGPGVTLEDPRGPIIIGAGVADSLDGGPQVAVGNAPGEVFMADGRSKRCDATSHRRERCIRYLDHDGPHRDSEQDFSVDDSVCDLPRGHSGDHDFASRSDTDPSYTCFAPRVPDPVEKPDTAAAAAGDGLRVCPVQSSYGDHAQCTLIAGHNGPHKNSDGYFSESK